MRGRRLEISVQLSKDKANSKTIRFLQIFKGYCDLMTSLKVETVNDVLDGICNLLQLAQLVSGLYNLCFKIKVIEAIEKLETLQNHNNEDIYKKAFSIVELYFSGNEGISEVAPQSGIFSF